MSLGEIDPVIEDDPITLEDTPPISEKRGRGRPRKNDTAPKKTGLPKASWPKAAGVGRSLQVSFDGIALGVALLNQKDALAIEEGAPDLIAAMIELGTNDSRYRRYLEAMAAPGKFGPIIIASSAIVLPIAANHGLFTMFSKSKPDNLITSPNMEE